MGEVAILFLISFIICYTLGFVLGKMIGIFRFRFLTAIVCAALPFILAFQSKDENGLLWTLVKYPPVFIATIILIVTHLKRIKRTSGLKYTYSYKEQTDCYYHLLYVSSLLLTAGHIFLTKDFAGVDFAFVITAFITILFTITREFDFIKKCDTIRGHIAAALNEMTVRFNYARFAIAHPLENHPLLFENENLRNQYLNILERFIGKYAHGDIISSGMLDNYKKFFLGVNGAYKTIEENKITGAYRNVFKKRRRKGVKAYRLQYVLMCDIITITGALDKKCFGVNEELKLYSPSKTHDNMDALLKIMLGENDEQTRKFDIKENLMEYHLDCWRKNKHFFASQERKVIVSSNMSSGKSTLINALIGKKINRSMNEACTTKLHFINDKAFEDNYIYKYDYSINLNAGIDALMEDNPKNKSNFVSVVSYFRYTGEKGARLCLIDSPGVNNSLDRKQEEIKKLIVSQDINVLLYIINAEYIGTNDDFTYLQYLQKTDVKTKIWFLVNKLDRFRLPEDSIDESTGKIREWLSVMGFEKPLVLPVSAYAGFLAKRKLFDDDMEENAIEDYELMLRKFRQDGYDLSVYYDIEIRNCARSFIEKSGTEHEDELNLLYRSGLLCLETMLYQGEKE
jgi:GTP-binding protein EngB required for normal cell division